MIKKYFTLNNYFCSLNEYYGNRIPIGVLEYALEQIGFAYVHLEQNSFAFILPKLNFNRNNIQN